MMTTRLAFVLSLGIAFSVAAAGRGNLNNILDDDSSQVASKAISLTAANGKMCQLCEQYSTEALLYLKQNETQTQILGILHHACANAAPLKLQCITLVDYYIPLFFLEVSTVNPEKFCESVHICKKGMEVRLPTREGACSLCHHVIVEVLMMLKTPNTQTEVIDLLLQTCSKAKNYEQQCKRLVVEYVPIILVKGQSFLETTDVCSSTHACKAGTQASIETTLLSASL